MNVLLLFILAGFDLSCFCYRKRADYAALRKRMYQYKLEHRGKWDDQERQI